MYHKTKTGANLCRMDFISFLDKTSVKNHQHQDEIISPINELNQSLFFHFLLPNGLFSTSVPE